MHLIVGKEWSTREYVMKGSVSAKADEKAVRALEREGIERVGIGFLFIFRGEELAQEMGEHSFASHHDLDYLWGGLACSEPTRPWVKPLRRKYWNLRGLHARMSAVDKAEVEVGAGGTA